MAVNVNYFFNFILFVSNKDQGGHSVDPAQFNVTAHRAQMQVFEKDYQTFLQTDQISGFLGLFLKNTILNVPITGSIAYPLDFEHTAAMRSYYVIAGGNSKETPVSPVKDADWGAIQMSQLKQPTLRFPKYTEFGTEFRFLPKNINIAFLDYFKTPVAPVWGYTLSSGRPVYDPTTSTDFEFDDFATNAVAANFLSLMGINLDSQALMQFAEMYKAQTNSTL